jgi:hypothetical protein
VDRLNLDPPAAPLDCFANNAGVVAVADNELVAVFDVCVLKGNFRVEFYFVSSAPDLLRVVLRKIYVV